MGVPAGHSHFLVHVVAHRSNLGRATVLLGGRVVKTPGSRSGGVKTDIGNTISKDITLAAREGGGEPEMNPALRIAIKKAIDMMSSNSILTILGKGRESYQVVNGEIKDFCVK